MTWEELRRTLVARRIDLGWSQLELSDRMMVRRSQLWEWETGRITPSASNLLKWLAALELEATFDDSSA